MRQLRPPADLDARYAPQPSFPEWSIVGVSMAVFDAANAAWAEQRRDADPDLVRAAIDFAVRAAAFDTGAIEGLYSTDRGVTFSVAVQTAAWEAAVARESGRDARWHFAAQLRAFELVLDAATGRDRITAAWLRALHETICAGQDSYRALTAIGWQDLPLPKGRFKDLPNHVLQPDGTWRSYAPVDLTQSEVQRLVDEINSDAFEAAHAVAQAAYVHHAFVGIHPFADGNGRVARALSSVFLYRAGRVPMLIFADDRLRYLAALRAADDGDRATLVTFARDVATDTIELVAQRLRAAQLDPSRDALARLSGLAAAIPWTGGDAELAAARVAEAVYEAVQDQATDIPPVAAELTLARFVDPPRDQKFDGYSLDGARSVRFVAASPRAPTTVVQRVASVCAAVDLASPRPLAVLAEGGAPPPLRLRREAVHPALTAVTRQRIRDWAGELVGEALGELADRVEEAASPIPEDERGR